MADQNQLMMVNPFEALETGRKRAYAGYEAGQAAAQREALNELYAQATDPRTGQVNMNALYSGLAQRRMGAAIPELQAQQAEIALKAGQAAKAAGEAAEATGKGKSAGTKALADKLQLFRERLPVNNPRLLPAWVESVYADPEVGSFMSEFGSKEDVIAGIPKDDPAKLNEWMQAASMLPSEYMKRQTVSEFERQDLAMRGRTADIQEQQARTAAAREQRFSGDGTAGPPAKLKQGEKWNAEKQRVEAVPGSDLYIKQSKTHSADFNTMKGVERQRDLAVTKIDALLNEENKDAFNNLFGGYNAYVSSQFSGKTADLKSQLDSLKSSLKTAGLQLIKQGSGGAIGQITEREWPILEGMIDTLTPTMREDTARQRLAAIKIFMDQLASDANDTYEMTYADSQFYKARSQLSAEDQQALDWANANPNDPRSAQIKAQLNKVP